MQEIKNRRYENAKHLKDGNVNKAMISSGIIHYNNHFGAGDGKKGLMEIDKSWINDGSKFYYEFANDPTSAGLKANEKITYRDYYKRRGYITSFIPQCNPVDGVIIGNELIYNHAFSNSIDLMLKTTNLSLQKLVRLRDYSIQDYTFDFEIIIENYTAKGLSIFRVDKTGQNETYSIDLMSLFTTPKVFDNPNRITVIGKTENDGTIIKPPKAWYYLEDERIEIDIKTELFGDQQNGKFYLRKHIPSRFLEQANGELVYTDTETTITSESSYSGTVARLSNTSWNDAYTGTGTNLYTSGSEMHRIMAKYRSTDGSDWAIHRVLLTFDISSFNASDTINNAVLFAKAEKFMDTGSAHNGKRYLQILKNTKTTPGSAVTKSDYQSFDDTNLYSEKSYSSTYSVGSWVAIQLNSTGISALQTAISNGDSFITLNIHTGFDIENINPTDGNRHSVEFYGSDDTGNEPYIEIDYSTGAISTPNKQVIIIT